jgi:hypothetical protein
LQPDPHPFELQKFRMKASCTDEVARGAHRIYPDVCPNCKRPVVIGPGVDYTLIVHEADEKGRVYITSSIPGLHVLAPLEDALSLVPEVVKMLRRDNGDEFASPSITEGK